MDQVAAGAALFPDSLVWIVPVARHLAAEADQHAGGGAIDLAAAAHEVGGGLDHLAVGVELHLAHGGGPHPTGSRAAVSGQVGELALAPGLAAEEIVEHV